MLTATLRSLVAHKARLAMTGLAVVLGVALMSGTLVLTDTVGRTFDSLFASAYAGTDAVVRSTDVVRSPFGQDQRAPIPADTLATVTATPGVAEAEPTVTGFAQIVAPDGEPVGNPAGGAPSIGGNWGLVTGLNPFTITDGAPPANAEDVVVDRASATTGGFGVGDTVTLLTARAPRSFTVSGLAAFGEVDSPGGASVALVTLDVAEDLFTTPGTVNEIGVVATSGTSEEQVVEALSAQLPDGIEAVTAAQRTAEDQSALGQALGFFNTFLLVFAVIALVVGAFIIYNTFSIVLAQRMRELALLRAVGASRRQVTLSVLGEALAVGLLASVIGLGLGALTAIGLRGLLGAAGIDIPSTSIVVSPTTAAIAIGVGTLITLAAAVFPALRASRVPPIAALRTVAVEPKPPVIRIVIGIGVVVLGIVNLVGGLTQGGDAALAGVAGGALLIFIGVAILGPAFARPVVRLLAWPLPRLRGITGTLARENASRNPRRTSTTAAALMIGVALVGFIAIFAASAKASIDQIIDESFSGDLIIDSGQFVNGGISTDLADAVRVTPGVAASTGVRFLTANLELPDASTPAGPTGDAAFVLGADTTALSEITDPQLTSGRVSGLELDEVAVATTVAEGAGLAVGDSVTARFPTGERTLTVTGTFDNRALLGDWMVDLATADAATVDRLDVQVWVKVADDASVTAVQDELKVVAKPWPTAQVLDLTEFKASQAEQFDQLLNLVYALLGLAVVIALVGIANTLALSVYERTREMGLMRAVGMDRRQLRAVVRWESVVIAVFGTLLGLVIGLFFGWVMVLALSEQGLGVLSIPVGTLAVVMVLSGLAGVVAALLPARRAGRLNVLTAIGSE